MNILLIGSGGREHALGVRMLQDPGVEKVWVYPGNPGMKTTLNLVPIPDTGMSFDRAFSIVQEKQIDFVMIGPEAPLYQGWVDQFSKAGIPAFGPTKAAAVLEESKIRAKQFMQENGIPTADFHTTKNLDDTLQVIRKHPEWDGYVLKLSGPALGKGVVVTRSAEEAIQAAKDFFKYSPPGIEDGIVVEEFIEGREVSLFYLCMDGWFKFLTSACDHKRLLDQDLGPNTGGMGAYSPANWIDPKLLKEAEEQFVVPTLQGMKKLNAPFTGVLFLGLMIKKGKPYLLEYNVRFGDPETQAILPRLKGNLSGLLCAAAKHDDDAFARMTISETREHSLHIVKAARGYPGIHGEKIEGGKEISLQHQPTRKEQFYFAGVKEENGKLYSNGGRVLGLTVLADSIPAVQKIAYEIIDSNQFEGEHFRKDIGAKR